MSSDERVRPYHAEERTRGQETAEAVAAVLKHAAARDRAAHEKAPPKKSPRWMLPVAVNLGVLAMYLLIAPPDWVVLDPIEPPTAEVQTESLRRALWALAQRVETYRVQNGRLPATLAELGSPVEGVDYVPSGESFQLVGSAGEVAVVYDSADAEDFLGSAALRFMEGG